MQEGDSRQNEPLTLDIILDREKYHDDAMQILSKVRPNWTQENIRTKVFTNGITNIMLGFTHGDDVKDVVLLRINGNKTEIFLNREQEIESFKILQKARCAPNLYCVFKNGLCYEFMHGNTVGREEVRQPHIFDLVAKEMAKVHKIEANERNGKRSVTFSNIYNFLFLRFSSDAPTGKGLDGYDGPSEKELIAEASMLEKHLLELDSPLVFTHNDLLLNNIIYNKKENTVHFIDYEYAGMNFQAFDIGNHMCEFAGVDDIDYSLYPGRELQLLWLRSYLKYWNEGTEPSDHDVEKLYVQVNKFALAAHFMWGIWALVQAKYSEIDFDYKGYAMQRLGEYYKQKEEFLALKMP